MIEEFRRKFKIGPGPVGIFVGSIYGAKRPEFLLAAADHVRGLIPDFELVVIGDGPLRRIFSDASRTRAWLHWVGARRGADLVHYASTGSLLLNPGLVGLAVLDGFALGLPTVTCDVPYHSPEIDYLRHDYNGLVLPADSTPQEFATTVADLLRSPSKVQRLAESAFASSTRYGVESMTERFVEGILAALRAPRNSATSSRAQLRIHQDKSGPT
jgi:glycosyltransferase involved in cell wall biosynthesis